MAPGEFGGPSPEEMGLTKEAPKQADRDIVNKTRKGVNSLVMESVLPTEEAQGYKSTVGIYGGKIIPGENGGLVYDMRGLQSKADQHGDRVLRTFDEHLIKRPGHMLGRGMAESFRLHSLKPLKKFFSMSTDAKRYRVTSGEKVMENVKRFGLEKYYKPHPNGIEINDAEAFTHSVALKDIYHQDEINSPALNNIDRFQALGTASQYMSELHQRAGGLAEGLTTQFLFEKNEGGKVSEPYLLIPTEIYNPEKSISEIDQKATDLLDLLVSAAAEELRRTEDWQNVNKALDTVLENYGDTKVIAMVKSFAKRGRLTLNGDTERLEKKVSATHKITHPAFAAHNTQRLGIKSSKDSSPIRNLVIEACEAYLKNNSEKQDEE